MEKNVRPNVNTIKPKRTRMRDFDLLLVVLLVALLSFGVIMVYSSSIALGDGAKFKNIGQYYFVSRHGIYILVGLIGMVFSLSMPIYRYKQYASWILIAAIIGLILVRVPFIGKQVNGAWRWIPLGPINFQVSEFAKLAVVLFFSAYVIQKEKVLHSFKKGLAPAALILAIIGALLLIEPDLGALVVVCVIVLGILFVAGLPWGYVLFSLVALCGFVALMIFAFPWRFARLMAFSDPFNPAYVDNIGYQLVQSLLAIGRGGWFGEGLGASITKLHYLPEAHTDFIMAVVSEELGSFGLLCVMGLFLVFIYRAIYIGKEAVSLGRAFGGFIAQGVGFWIAVQVLVNLSVVSGFAPTKGLTMPFISYGGSSMVMMLIGVGLLFRVDYENRQVMRGRSIEGEK